ncbi:TetR/AcrR family transcriptional regulator [Nocardia sp. NPDC005825]|uniref:TetR/AcrR family transcriptional regulator n=1 Tax=unclassified Nocardia TaxID=2637762 RepID=UPI0033FBA4DD
MIDAALKLTEDGSSFDALSLRQMAQVAGVAPSAFYRYFQSLDDLGLAIVEESFRRLRAILVDMTDANPTSLTEVISTGISALRAVVTLDSAHLGFIARQRAASHPILRREIRAQIRLQTSQMATYLARFEPISSWRVRDVEMLANLLMSTVVNGVDSMLEALSLSLEAEATERELDNVTTALERQILYLFIGVPGWRSR